MVSRVADRFDRQAPPDVIRECMRELRRVDPHLLVIFNTWWFELKTEGSAAAVRRMLISEGCSWVPCRAAFYKRFNAMRETAAQYVNRVP